MQAREILVALLVGCSTLALSMSAATARADGDLHKVNHIIIVMQENRSFDHYFGALPYVPGGEFAGDVDKFGDGVGKIEPVRRDLVQPSKAQQPFQERFGVWQ